MIAGLSDEISSQEIAEFSVAIGARVVTFLLLMKCDSCQEKATVFYTQVAEGKLKKFMLCESCAEEKGITNPEGLLMAEELLGVSATPAQPSNPFPPIAQVDCAGCGFTLEDFRKVGRLGCPQCYDAFSQEITQRLPTLHKSTSHKGYIPEGLVKQKAIRSELTSLSADLEKAIAEERFEEAAAIRDRINDLERKEEGVPAQ